MIVKKKRPINSGDVSNKQKLCSLIHTHCRSGNRIESSPNQTITALAISEERKKNPPHIGRDCMRTLEAKRSSTLPSPLPQSQASGNSLVMHDFLFPRARSLGVHHRWSCALGGLLVAGESRGSVAGRGGGPTDRGVTGEYVEFGGGKVVGCHFDGLVNMVVSIMAGKVGR